MRARVERRVVMRDVLAESEIPRRESVIDEEREVGVVGKEFVDDGRKRASRVGVNVSAVDIEQRAVAGTHLEQKAWSSVAARLDIHDRANTRLQIRFVKKGGGTEKS